MRSVNIGKFIKKMISKNTNIILFYMEKTKNKKITKKNNKANNKEK